MQARRLPARQGVAWILGAFHLLRSNPPLLSILSFLYLMIAMLMLVLPGGIGGILFPIVQPLLVLVFANACRSIDGAVKIKSPGDLLGNLSQRRKQLLQLGALQLVGSVLVMLIVMALGLMPDPKNPEALPKVMAVTAGLSLPLLLAFWFGPVLTGWHALPPVKALFFSAIAVARNWQAFAVYGGTLIAIILVPATLALLAQQVSASFGQMLSTVVEILFVVLLVPVVLAGPYISYRDIFATSAEAQ